MLFESMVFLLACNWLSLLNVSEYPKLRIPAALVSKLSSGGSAFLDSHLIKYRIYSGDSAQAEY